MAGFRKSQFDPLLILFQICAMQSVFYASSCLYIAIYSNFPSSEEITTDLVFTTQTRKATFVIQLMAILTAALSTVFLIQRAKSVLDSFITLHFIHFFVVLLYNFAFPVQLSWWFLQICSCAVGTLVGEYLCMKSETREIVLDKTSLIKTPSNTV
uniref:Protein SYS1 homolog n=1 Tax=Rhabditophanes sp. KR3021 TaxID=114890 RepID=A0AC35TZ09_9BILA